LGIDPEISRCSTSNADSPLQKAHFGGLFYVWIFAEIWLVSRLILEEIIATRRIWQAGGAIKFVVNENRCQVARQLCAIAV
jgi:hypothetical protein